MLLHSLSSGAQVSCSSRQIGSQTLTCSVILEYSMVVIVVSVAVRGPGVEDTLKGDPNERWTILESGFFEAIGVISFAFVVSPLFSLLSTAPKLICALSLVPPQLTPNIRFPPDSHPRSIRSSHTRIHHPLSRRMPLHVH